MIFGGGIVGFAVFALWIYCILDVIATNEMLVRNLPKFVWLLLVIILPAVGSIAWLLLGRPERAGFRPGDTDYRGPRRVLGPEDSPDHLARIDNEAKRLREWEDDLETREEDLRRREEGDQGTT